MKRGDFVRATTAFAAAPSVPVPDTILKAKPKGARERTTGLSNHLNPAHYLSITDGRLVDPPDAVDAHYDLISRTLSTYRDAAKLPIPTLAVFFHGGLVSIESGMQTAKVLYPDLVDAGAIPMFFLWHSGVSDAWRPFKGDAETECAEQLPRHPDHSLLRRHFDRKSRVAARVGTRTDHLTPETDFEELIRQYNLLATATTWGNMKQSICAGFDPNSAFQPAAMRYITELTKALNADPRPLRVLLVAHSAGAIYVSRFLEHYNAVVQTMPGTPAANMRFELVFWAPAVSFQRFRRTVEHDAAFIRSLRLFGLNDDLELNDTLLVPTGIPLISHIYRHSLLYIVSGAFEPLSEMPLLGMERFHNGSQYADRAKFPDIAAVKDWLGNKHVPLIWSQTPFTDPPGFRSRSMHHGDFPGDPMTVESLVHQIHDEMPA